MGLDLSDFLKGLQAGRQVAIKAAAAAVDAFAEHVIGDAQQLAPVKTGALQASGTTLPLKIEGTKLIKELGFNTDYAAAVHENLQNHHDVGQAKFLTTAMEKNSSKLGPFIAKRIKAALDSQGGEGGE